MKERNRITLKIPLTLAIIDKYDYKNRRITFLGAITSIRESFKARNEDIIIDSEGNEMIMIRVNVMLL